METNLQKKREEDEGEGEGEGTVEEEITTNVHNQIIFFSPLKTPSYLYIYIYIRMKVNASGFRCQLAKSK